MRVGAFVRDDLCLSSLVMIIISKLSHRAYDRFRLFANSVNPSFSISGQESIMPTLQLRWTVLLHGFWLTSFLLCISIKQKASPTFQT
jgi:hypothetical protein